MSDDFERRTGIAPNGKPYESVWDYPRPPRLESVEWRIGIVHAGVTIVDAPRAWRVLETSQPPAYYVAPEFIDLDRMAPSSAGTRTVCEWKGVAQYADVVEGGMGGPSRRVADAAWSYPSPTPAFSAMGGHWAFYPQRMDECWVDDERVASNEGNFYGGWITANVTGPFKGAPGTAHW
jgi:uncharacterized protein (DUF427 family)